MCIEILFYNRSTIVQFYCIPKRSGQLKLLGFSRI